MRRGTWIRALGVRMTPDLKGMMPLGMDRAPGGDDPPDLRPESPSCCRTSTSSEKQEREKSVKSQISKLTEQSRYLSFA